MPADDATAPPSRAGAAPGRKSGWRTTIAAGVGLGLLAALLDLSAAGRWLERTIARQPLFEARGVRPPPPGVVVISMDEDGAQRLPAMRESRRWSRRLYAALIERLSAAGASAVVLDVAFEEVGEAAADRALEQALSRSGRVVLFQRLARTALGDVPVPPLSRFVAAARAHAVFPLPKTPTRVEYYWPFFRVLEPVRTGEGHATGGEYALSEVPSLPVAALQTQVSRRLGAEGFARLLADVRRASGDVPIAADSRQTLTRMMVALRREAMSGRFATRRTEPFLNERHGIDARSATLLRALFGAFSERDVVYLNFYGPSRTIVTLGHRRVLDDAGTPAGELRDTVAGKVVFVGHSGRSAVDQMDGFRTVYSRGDGVDLSGVEIAATAYANLADGSMLRPVTPVASVLIHVLLGVACMVLALRAGVVRAVAFSVALAFVWFAVCVQAFGGANRLLPLGVPLLALLPSGLFAGLLARHLRTRRERDRYHHGTRLLLPGTAVRDIESDRVDRASPERLHGTCLISDVANYTPLSESLAPERLASLSREYFALLTERTRLGGGELIDLEGDSMTAIWARTAPTAETGRLAASTAVAMLRATERFNANHVDTPFVTRLGLHQGWLSAVNIGGGRVYRHRVVGDVVNTASRLEGLNKRLGTSILATRPVIARADGLLVRPLGRFVLTGKREALEVIEVVNERASASARERALRERFEVALAALAAGERAEAERRFNELLDAFGTDGPSSFYVELLRGQGPPDVRLDGSGTVIVAGK